MRLRCAIWLSRGHQRFVSLDPLARGQSLVVKIGERFAADRIVDLARRAMRIIRQSLSLALLFNVVGIALTVTGLLSPLI